MKMISILSIDSLAFISSLAKHEEPFRNVGDGCRGERVWVCWEMKGGGGTGGMGGGGCEGGAR